MMQRHLDTGSVPAPQAGLRGLPSSVLPPGAVALPENGTWSLEVEPGATVALRAGRAWLTLEGDAADHILDAPTTFTAPHRGRVALWAFTPVRFDVDAPPARRAA
ncbi:MAG: DUF2917 domain-containing protein [Deltaproteobacteria bacterium]|nr:DUF2917 domain-containing protein [Deltaproteobacteria bacterium]